jgi:hypothetical protein
VEASWLNQSLAEKVKLLAHVAPEKAKALEVLLDAAHRDEWREMKPARKAGTGARRPSALAAPLRLSVAD